MTDTEMADNPHLLALGMAAQGFQSFSTGPTVTDFHQISERAWLWQWYHYSTLVLRTDNGLAVVDPADARSAALLKDRLREEFGDLAVDTMLYSHEHLDHASGGAVLEPATVIGHRGIGSYLEAYGHHDVVPPTRPLADGDHELDIDGLGVKLHHIPGAHTHGLFAFEVPSESILHIADLAAVRATPFVLQNLEIPPTIAVLDRLCDDVDFDVFVPAHFREGTKQDLRDCAGFFRDLRSASDRALIEGGGLSTDADVLMGQYRQVYNELAPRYGDWHGFNEQIHLFVMRGFFGEVIGY